MCPVPPSAVAAQSVKRRHTANQAPRPAARQNGWNQESTAALHFLRPAPPERSVCSLPATTAIAVREHPAENCRPTKPHAAAPATFLDPCPALVQAPNQYGPETTLPACRTVRQSTTAHGSAT